MGAGNSSESGDGTLGSPGGGLLAARALLLERTSEDHLDISVDDVDALIRKLGSAVARPPGENMHFTCRALRDPDIVALGSLAMLQPTGLQAVVSVNLAHNSVGDAGAEALGRALASGAPHLRRLQLHENRIGNVGMVALAKAMLPGGAPNLEVIRIEFNRIGDDGMCALADAWAGGGATDLSELHASGNEVTDVGLGALAAQLGAAPRLRLLAFGSSSGGNLIGDPGARALAEALRTQPKRPHGTLTICLKTNKLTPGGEAELQTSLKELAPDESLAVSFTSLSSTRNLPPIGGSGSSILRGGMATELPSLAEEAAAPSADGGAALLEA